MSAPRKFEALGKTQSVTEWSREVGIPANVIFFRLNSGWPGDDIVTRPNRGIDGLSSKNPSEYRIWKDMRRRCVNPKRKGSNNYVGRGISVCARWQSFANFIADMGPRPSDEHSIDRRDNDGGYEPGNCYWATSGEQQRNKRNSHLLTHDGETMCIAGWTERLGVGRGTIGNRINNYGWSVEEALTVPPGGYRRGRCKTLLTIDGETLSISEWCGRYGICQDVFRARFYRCGWSVLDALRTPVGVRRHERDN